MRFPSLSRAAASARRSLLRFPLVLAGAGLAAAAALVLVDAEGDAPLAGRLLVTGLLAMPLFFALRLFAERRRAGAGARAALAAGGAVALAGFFVAWRGWTGTEAATRFFHLAAAFHLLVAVLPYAGHDEPHGFWHYNRILFLRFLEAVLFSAVLFLGLALALGAVDQLLGIDVPGDTYWRLFVLVALVFHPWFTVAGVPRELEALEARRDYPTGLKVFAQFVLVPLVVVYLAILLAYLGKVLVTGEWPSGWIGWLVSGLAVVGILALLLVHPIRERAENRWIVTYGRGFFVALLPAVGMLLAAVWKRVDQYGITERRYFLALLALWLAGIALWYVLRRHRGIRLIPASLCLLAVVTFAGPWSAYEVSRASQRARLEALLARTGAAAPGAEATGGEPGAAGEAAGAAAGAASSRRDLRELSAVLRYLIGTHGPEAVAPWVDPEGLADAGGDAAALGPLGTRQVAAEAAARAAAGRLGVRYVGRWAGRPGAEEFFSYHTGRERGALELSGWDVLLRPNPALTDTFDVRGRRVVVSYDDQRRVLDLRAEGEPLVRVPLGSLLDSLAARDAGGPEGPTPPGPRGEPLALEASGEGVDVRLLVRSLSGRLPPSGDATLEGADLELLLRLGDAWENAADPPAAGTPGRGGTGGGSAPR